MRINSSQRPNISVFNWVLSGEDGEVTIVDQDFGDWGFRIGEGESQKVKNRVDGFSMSTIMRKNSMDAVDIFKIDIEGAERFVFNADISFLDLTSVIVIELHPDVEDSVASYSRCLAKHNPYSIHGKGENLIIKFRN